MDDEIAIHKRIRVLLRELGMTSADTPEEEELGIETLELADGPPETHVIEAPSDPVGRLFIQVEATDGDSELFELVPDESMVERARIFFGEVRWEAEDPLMYSIRNRQPIKITWRDDPRDVL